MPTWRRSSPTSSSAASAPCAAGRAHEPRRRAARALRPDTVRGAAPPHLIAAPVNCRANRRPLGRRARRRALAERDRRLAIHHTHADEIDFAEALALRAPHRRPGAAGDRLPAARGAPEGARRLPQRAQGSALRDLAPHRRDAQRQLGRHRRRHRHALRLRVDGRQRAAVGQPAARRPGGAARQEGPLRRHAHPGAARRRRRAHQRLQLPGLGPAREVRADLSRRHAVHRQAGDGDELSHRGAGAHDGGLGPAARRAACSSSSARPATCSTGSTARTSSPSPARPTPR